MIDPNIYDTSVRRTIGSQAAYLEALMRQLPLSMPFSPQLLNDQMSSIERILSAVHIPDFSSLVSPMEMITRDQLLYIADQATALASIGVWQEPLRQQMAVLAQVLGPTSQQIAAQFSAINLAFANAFPAGIFDDLKRFYDLDIESAEAFKAAGWLIAPSMSRNLRRHVSKLYKQNKRRYISRAIMAYYERDNHANLSAAVEAWQENPLFAPRMHIVRDALAVHCEGRCTLSVPALLPLIEGVLIAYVSENNLIAKSTKIRDVYSAAIGDPNDYPFAVWTIASTLRYQLETSTYVYTDFVAELRKSVKRRATTRHTVLHGITPGYDRPIHSLKAFLLLDAVSALCEPINEEAEENSD